MIFRKITIAGTAWLHEDVTTVCDQISKDKKNAKNGSCSMSQSTTLENINIRSPSPPGSTLRHQLKDQSEDDQVQPLATTSKLMEYMCLNPESPFSATAREFFLGMALCHTCLPEIKDGKMAVQGSSPDEIALVRAAQDLGYRLVHRSLRMITLLVNEDGNESQKSYEILDVIEFSSKRKRMTIILRCPDGRIWLICKGADSIILPRLRRAELAAREAEELQKNLDL